MPIIHWPRWDWILSWRRERERATAPERQSRVHYSSDYHKIYPILPKNRQEKLIGICNWVFRSNDDGVVVDFALMPSSSRRRRDELQRSRGRRSKYELCGSYKWNQCWALSASELQWFDDFTVPTVVVLFSAGADFFDAEYLYILHYSFMSFSAFLHTHTHTIRLLLLST